MKLYITDKGDPSVGIMEQQYEIDAPFDYIDMKNMQYDDMENLEYFKTKMVELYSEFSDGKMVAYYGFELIQEAEEELKNNM